MSDKREKIEIFVEKCRESAVLPCYAHPDDAGMDIYAAETVEIAPGATALVPTGLKMAIPDGFELQVRPRSGLSLKTALRVPNAPGTVDAGYRNEISVIVWNSSPTEPITVNRGDRIAQFILARVPMAAFTEVDNVASIGVDRGGGFGSSGVSGSLSGSSPAALASDPLSVPRQDERQRCGGAVSAIGQDSHAFTRFDPDKPLILGGVKLDDQLTLRANSDGDVLLHALTNALSGITGRNILGGPADELCQSGTTDSAAYLRLALDDLDAAGYRLTHISFSIEAARPRLAAHIQEIKESIARLCGIAP
ncbi:MAG: dUTP diphosphatase, partial [Clostridia bacterium]|nr:dUTP diphosphatase [Clostridia bacterium]